MQLEFEENSCAPLNSQLPVLPTAPHPLVYCHGGVNSPFQRRGDTSKCSILRVSRPGDQVSRGVTKRGWATPTPHPPPGPEQTCLADKERPREWRWSSGQHIVLQATEEKEETLMGTLTPSSLP